MLDPLEPVLRRLLRGVAGDQGAAGDGDPARGSRLRRVGRSGPAAAGELRPTAVRPAQRTGYRPGQVLQLDWGEMPTRPKIAGRERRVYALVATLPYSGAQTAHFSFDLTAESFLEGHVRIFDWLGGVVRECVYDNLRSAVARRDGDQVTWNQRFLALRGHYAFHAHACTPATPREKGSVEGGVRHLKTGFWPARRFGCLAELDEQYARWRDRSATAASTRPAGSRSPSGSRTSARSCGRCRRRAFDFAGARPVRVPLDGYLKLGGNFYRAPIALVHQRVELRFDRDHVWIRHAGADVASYPRSWDRGHWFPPPQLRPEPPGAGAGRQPASSRQIAPPELADYAELCA